MTLHVVPGGPEVDPSPRRALPTTTIATALPLLIGRSVAMERLRAEVRRYAVSAATVLVTGESGSGKELVARALHDGSPRHAKPFVAVNVATLGRDLLGSELFGHERGAFTGAVNRHVGLFEQANNGTLFLDEIGELSAGAQADLLRVLETGQTRPVGSERVREVNVRIVAATHRDLAEMVSRGAFREDLYYRLHVLPLRVPSLRERLEDLPLLVMHLLARMSTETGERSLSLPAMSALGQYPWPGNVRQLMNVLRRASAQTDAAVIDREVVLGALAVEPSGEMVAVRGEVSPAVITEALRVSRGSVASVARELGVPRSTLRYWIRRDAALAR